MMVFETGRLLISHPPPAEHFRCLLGVLQFFAAARAKVFETAAVRVDRTRLRKLCVDRRCHPQFAQSAHPAHQISRPVQHRKCLLLHLARLVQIKCYEPRLSHAAAHGVQPMIIQKDCALPTTKTSPRCPARTGPRSRTRTCTARSARAGKTHYWLSGSSPRYRHDTHMTFTGCTCTMQLMSLQAVKMALLDGDATNINNIRLTRDLPRPRRAEPARPRAAWVCRPCRLSGPAPEFKEVGLGRSDCRQNPAAQRNVP